MHISGNRTFKLSHAFQVVISAGLEQPIMVLADCADIPQGELGLHRHTHGEVLTAEVELLVVQVLRPYVGKFYPGELPRVIIEGRFLNGEPGKAYLDPIQETQLGMRTASPEGYDRWPNLNTGHDQPEGVSSWVGYGAVGHTGMHGSMYGQEPQPQHHTLHTPPPKVNMPPGMRVVVHYPDVHPIALRQSLEQLGVDGIEWLRRSEMERVLNVYAERHHVTGTVHLTLCGPNAWEKRAYVVILSTVIEPGHELFVFTLEQALIQQTERAAVQGPNTVNTFFADEYELREQYRLHEANKNLIVALDVLLRAQGKEVKDLITTTQTVLVDAMEQHRGITHREVIEIKDKLVWLEHMLEQFDKHHGRDIFGLRQSLRDQLSHDRNSLRGDLRRFLEEIFFGEDETEPHRKGGVAAVMRARQTWIPRIVKGTGCAVVFGAVVCAVKFLWDRRGE